VACIVRVLYILGSVKLQSIYVPRELVCELKQARRVLDSSHSRRLDQSFGRTIRANTFMKVVWGGNRDLAYHTLSSRLSAGRPLKSIGVYNLSPETARLGLLDGREVSVVWCIAGRFVGVNSMRLRDFCVGSANNRWKICAALKGMTFVSAIGALALFTGNFAKLVRPTVVEQ
jgi:hypothetical protein